MFLDSCMLLLLPLLLLLPASGFVQPPWLTTAATTDTRREEAPQQYRRSRARSTATRSTAVGASTTGGHVPSDSPSPAAPQNLLEQLQMQTTIWADTADVDTVRRLEHDLGVVDVTTNPSIVSATARKDDGAAEDRGRLRVPTYSGHGEGSALEDHERIAVDLGRRLLDAIPGRVCTQLDIRCTDAERMVEKARDIVAMYAKAGMSQERVMIKTPATWAGIRATERLEREGIRCLVTLVCSRVQGLAAAEAGASLIATYVGRVSDWHKTVAVGTSGSPAVTSAAAAAAATTSAAEDHGVLLTLELKDCFASRGLPTEVMAASFRNVEQVVSLSGCHHLTIAPGLIEELAKLPPRAILTGGEASNRKAASNAEAGPGACTCRAPAEAADQSVRLDEESFVAALGQDACGTEVLRSSVGGFTRDTLALEAAIANTKAATHQQQQQQR